MRPLRFLLVDAGAADGGTSLVARLRAATSSEVDVECGSTMTGILRRLEVEPRIDVVVLDPEVPDLNVLEAFATLHERAPDMPVVVMTRMEGDHLALALSVVTRSPRSAGASARRVATLLPAYVERRAEDVELLDDALVRDDFEAVARIGHNLRGNGVSFGFPELRALGERIEAAALTRDSSALRELVARFHAYVRRILGGRPPALGGSSGRASGARVRVVAPDDPQERESEP